MDITGDFNERAFSAMVELKACLKPVRGEWEDRKQGEQTIFRGGLLETGAKKWGSSQSS